MLAYFEKDVADALANARRLYPKFSGLPEEAQQIIVNMIFNMGFTGLV